MEDIVKKTYQRSLYTFYTFVLAVMTLGLSCDLDFGSQTLGLPHILLARA
jgi:hypothetical protein